MVLAHILTGLLASLAVAATFTQTPTGAYSTYAADSVISRGQGNGLTNGKPQVNYPDGEFQWALRLLFERGGNQSYFGWIQAGVNRIVSSTGQISSDYNLSAYTLDYLRLGPSFIYLYQMTGEQKYKTAADTFRSQLNTHPRTAQGQFWHKLIYPNQGWLDGIYMGEPFYAAYTAAFQPTNQTAWDDIHLQFSLMYENTVQLKSTNSHNTTSTGLLYHGYDHSHVQSWASPDRGHSPEVWDRALGWYSMALVDVLGLVPASQVALRSTLASQLQSIADNLVKQADNVTNAWWLVLTQPGRSGNYFESSGGCMFIYAMLRGVRLGYIKDTGGSIIAAAQRAFGYAISNWVIPKSNGTMDFNNTVIVGSLQPGNDYEYYISQQIDINDLKGVAAFVLASYEIEML
ncbi:Six-hairpin glycosidase [Vararia minispora EC-137]|uniref:Six-hairpin glycosidase n=1 Tax=Vararia minispora EC-137 TaxID=1314806 RepID=A0ACB8QWT5_9AGAM|nr:Six-hairpin glycosidase [Vararia minispora EC-137]